VFEPMKAPYEIIDTSRDLIPQIGEIIEKNSIGKNL
jgi:hypothetical protein